MENLWKVAFPFGLMRNELDAFYDLTWQFNTLEEACEEGGVLFGKKVFAFLAPEPHAVSNGDEVKIIQIPTIIAIESTIPPSDKIACAPMKKDAVEIIPMKEMEMSWVPYTLFERRDTQVEIFILCSEERRAAIRNLEDEDAGFFFPYFYNPVAEDERKQGTEVFICFPSDEMPRGICVFDWELDEVEEFVDHLIEDGKLWVEEREEFTKLLKEPVEAEKKANREARDARRIEIEEMSEDTIKAFQNMKFYKFYPQLSSPDLTGCVKTPFISRYYGYAHQVL